MKSISKTLIAVFIGLFSLSVLSCKKNNGIIVSTSCHPNQAVLRTATNQTGTFGYDDAIKLNTITVVSGNVTSVYFICNPPATLPQIGASTTFSGDVRASTRGASGSMTYYELTVTSLN